MSTIESRASLLTFKQARRINPASITYTREGDSGELVAIGGDTIVEVNNEDGTTTRMKVRDYLILRSELEEIIGVGETPLRGDVIEEVVAGYTRTFDVFELGDEIFRWWDKSMQVFRIHTVEVSKETTTGTTDGA